MLPAELTVHQVGADTSDEDDDKLDALTQSCGVLLPASAFLRGDARPSVFLFAKTALCAPAGVAASIAENPPASSEGGRAWRGMLSTSEQWRGRGIAKLLGAMALIEMAKRHNLQRF